MSDVDALKRKAARAALEEVESGMVLGLGTGSTVAHFLELLARAIRRGERTDVVGVPTSVETASAAEAGGIPVTGLEDRPTPDLTVDGADEIDPSLELIKGMGGALLREKVVAQASRRMVVIADGRKVVDRLGTRSPLPVEAVPFAWTAVRDFLRPRCTEVSLREERTGEAYVTDNGNYVLDCRFEDGVSDPAALEAELQSRAGLVETGLFLGIADTALVATDDGLRRIDREEER